MILFAYNTEFELQGMIDNYISLQWTEEYNGKGSFELICVDTSESISALQQGYYVCAQNKSTAMMIRYIERDSINKTITINGCTTLGLLEQRVMFPMHSTLGRTIEESLYFFVNQGFNKTAHELGEAKTFYQQQIDVLTARHDGRSQVRELLFVYLGISDKSSAQVQVIRDCVSTLNSNLDRLTIEYDSTSDSVNYTESEVQQAIDDQTNRNKSTMDRWLEYATDENRRINRIITAESLDGIQGYDGKVLAEYTGKDTFDVLVGLAEIADLGLRMEFDVPNKRHVFRVYQGADRTHEIGSELAIMPFVEEYGNLNGVVITDDMLEFKNVAYVAGEDSGAYRRTVLMGATALSGLERRELYVDARDIQSEYTDDDGNTAWLSDDDYYSMLHTRGLEKLEENAHGKFFEGEVDPSNYGTDYVLGDVVTCISKKYGIRLDTRITQVQEVMENNIKSIHLVFGTQQFKLI